MGSPIGDIVPKHKITLESLNNKKLAFDSHNIIYQFLSSIRGEDGQPLKDSNGNITSHLAGLFYRTTHLFEYGIKPIFVFDGKPSLLKTKTLEKRRETRTKAFEMHEKALEEGNMEEAKKFGARALKLEPKMVEEAKELIRILGFPVIEAPSEGEAQASWLVSSGLAEGIVSQDYDSLLFGAPTIYRNVAISGKRKLPNRNVWLEAEPEKITLEEALTANNISRKQLIWIAILVGTDFNEKFPRIGIKTALKIVKDSKSFEEVISKTNHSPEFDYKEVETIFLNPQINKDVSINFGEPNKEELIKFLCEKHNFSFDRVSKTIDKLIEKKAEKSKQKTLGDWS
ncbi:MAG: flap endonuclease-1 [Candidatus Diapherotrites archaeon]